MAVLCVLGEWEMWRWGSVDWCLAPLYNQCPCPNNTRPFLRFFRSAQAAKRARRGAGAETGAERMQASGQSLPTPPRRPADKSAGEPQGGAASTHTPLPKGTRQV